MVVVGRAGQPAVGPGSECPEAALDLFQPRGACVVHALKLPLRERRCKADFNGGSAFRLNRRNFDRSDYFLMIVTGFQRQLPAGSNTVLSVNVLISSSANSWERPTL
jgi:hypothetical protein